MFRTPVDGFFQPRPQGFSLKKWVGHPFFKGKALGTRLGFFSDFLRAQNMVRVIEGKIIQKMT